MISYSVVLNIRKGGNIMDLSWLWKKKEEKEKTPKINDLFEYSKKSTEDLIQLYRSEKYLIERLENRNMGLPLENGYYKETAKMENELIGRISDEFEKKVLRIAVGFRFNLLEYMDKKWEKEISEGCLYMCHYLRFGNRYPNASQAYNPLPFPGHEFFIWLLSHTGDDKNNHMEEAIRCAATEFRQNRIIGKEFPEEKIRNENLPPLMESVGMRLLTLMSPEFSRELKIIIEIWKMEGGEGEKYLQKILKEMP
jgi:hypothetical protein